MITLPPISSSSVLSASSLPRCSLPLSSFQFSSLPFLPSPSSLIPFFPFFLFFSYFLFLPFFPSSPIQFLSFLLCTPFFFLLFLSLLSLPLLSHSSLPSFYLCTPDIPLDSFKVESALLVPDTYPGQGWWGNLGWVVDQLVSQRGVRQLQTGSFPLSPFLCCEPPPTPGFRDFIFMFSLPKKPSEVPCSVPLGSGEGGISFKFSIQYFKTLWCFSQGCYFFREIWVEQVAPDSHSQWRSDCWLVWSPDDEYEKVGYQTEFSRANSGIRDVIRLETEVNLQLYFEQG